MSHSDLRRRGQNLGTYLAQPAVFGRTDPDNVGLNKIGPSTCSRR
jgi:hypothetical protein